MIYDQRQSVTRRMGKTIKRTSVQDVTRALFPSRKCHCKAVRSRPTELKNVVAQAKTSSPKRSRILKPFDGQPWVFGVSPRTSIDFEVKEESCELETERNEIDEVLRSAEQKFRQAFVCLAPRYQNSNEEHFTRNYFDCDTVHSRAIQAMNAEGYRIIPGNFRRMPNRPRVFLFDMEKARHCIRNRRLWELNVKKSDLMDEPSSMVEELSDAGLFRLQINRFLYHFKRELKANALRKGRPSRGVYHFTLGEKCHSPLPTFD